MLFVLVVLLLLCVVDVGMIGVDDMCGDDRYCCHIVLRCYYCWRG